MIRKFLTFISINTGITKLVKDSYCLQPERKKDTLLFVLFNANKGVQIRTKILSEIRKNSIYCKNFIIRNKQYSPEVS